ncbi:MAG: alpha/beta hydrolase [Alphaproteobacteria bacterium]|nr:alpha/beta hydrolase [Alphaproteobacteria bacterium]
MPLDAIVKGLLEQMAANPMPKLWEVPPGQGRELYRMMSQTLEPQGIAIGKIENVSFAGPSGDQIKLRLYSPVAGGGAALPALVYFHGGGWVIGDLDTHDALCRTLTNDTGARVISVDYRLAPEHKFPAAVDDCYAAVKWVEQNASNLGIDANRIAVGGDSAGGNLAAVMCLMAKKSGPRLVYQLLIYPVTQFKAETKSMNAFAQGYVLEKQAMTWFFDQYAPGSDPNDWRVSPLAAPDVAGLPRAYVVTAGFDPLRDEGKAYADKLNRAGVAAVHVDYPGMVHGFFNMQGVLPVARTAIADAAKALRKAFEG